MPTPEGDKRTCIFCGGGGMTKEDYWPQWFQRLNERKWNKHAHMISRVDHEGDIHIKQSLRPGDPTESKLGRVCGPCNNGWMSRLQSAAKPLIGELLQGKWRDLSRLEQCTLAAWATMFAMVVEYLDPRTVAISQEQRTEFFRTGGPPENFKVWIGRLMPGTRHHGSFYHQALSVYLEGEPRPNVQSNVIALDGLLFLVVSARRNYVIGEQLDSDKDFHFGEIELRDWLNLGLGQLWPVKGARLAPPERSLDDHDYNDLVHILQQCVTVGPREVPLLLAYDPNLPEEPMKAEQAGPLPHLSGTKDS